MVLWGKIDLGTRSCPHVLTDKTSIRSVFSGRDTSERVSFPDVILPRPRECLQGYLAHNKQPPPLGPPQDPRYSSTEGSSEGVFYMIEVPLYLETSNTRTRTRVGALLLKTPALYLV